jgi:hypothetical protein
VFEKLGEPSRILKIRMCDMGWRVLTDRGSLLSRDSEGRFSKLMPRHKPSLLDVDRAKHQLLVLGTSVENRGFDPNMN